MVQLWFRTRIECCYTGCHQDRYSNICDCLRETLKTWLKTYLPPPTWSEVLEALRTKIVGEAKLAAYLEQKYCTAQGTCTAAATLSPQSTVPITPPYHPTQDTTAAATLSSQSTVPITPPYHPTQDTSTAAATLTVTITPPYHPTQEHMGMPLASNNHGIR